MAGLVPSRYVHQHPPAKLPQWNPIATDQEVARRLGVESNVFNEVSHFHCVLRGFACACGRLARVPQLTWAK